MRKNLFTDAINSTPPSEIRKLLQIINTPEILSFAGGLPAPELFPIEEIKKITQKLFSDFGKNILQYSAAEGYDALREVTAQRMHDAFGIKTTKDSILITSGSQQGLEFTGKIFIEKNDAVIVEKPSYLGALQAFGFYGPRFIEVDSDAAGIKMDALEAVLKSEHTVKFLYTIPDFQNPTGVTWSLERRKKLIELAHTYDFYIIEDAPYSELRFSGDFIPPLKYFDTEGRVIFLGTYSKIFCPGLRVGWVCADIDVLEKYIGVKQLSDLHSSTLTQAIVAHYIQEYDIEAHIARIRTLYKTRRDAMMSALEAYFPKEVTYVYPDGGLFTWVSLPEYMDAGELAYKAIEKKVAYVPGESFYANRESKNHFRLNFSSNNEDTIRKGIEILGSVIKKELR